MALAQTPPAHAHPDPTPAQLAASLGPAQRAARRIHQAVAVTALGTGRDRVYCFEPREPALPSAPVVLFLHGWRGMNPHNFGAWIDHLVRSGHIVVYPVYQDDADTPPRLVTDAALHAFSRALDTLKAPGHTHPTRAAAIGYSLGASITANIAAEIAHSTDSTSAANALPPLEALFLVHPGDAHHVAHGAEARSILRDLTPIPSSTLVLALAGEDDDLVGHATAADILRRLPHVTRRELLIVPSDPASSLTAHHGAPGAPDARYDFDHAPLPHLLRAPADFPPSSKSINDLDHFAYWKLADALLDAAFRSGDLALAFGSPAQRFMGLGPDGRPRRPLYPREWD